VNFLTTPLSSVQATCGIVPFQKTYCSPQQLNLPSSGLNAYTSLADSAANDSLVLLVLRLSPILEELNPGHRNGGGACTAVNILTLFVANEASPILCFMWNCSSSSSSSLLSSSSRRFAMAPTCSTRVKQRLTNASQMETYSRLSIVVIEM